MIGWLAAVGIICNINVGTCTFKEENQVVMQICLEDGQPNHMPPKKVVTADGQQVIIYYVTCEEA